MTDYRNDICQAVMEISKDKTKTMGLHFALAFDGDRTDFLSEKEMAHRLREYIVLNQDIQPFNEDFEEEDY